MLEVQGEDPESGYQVNGFAGAPSLTRANRTYMTFFVNRRWVQSRMLSFAVEEAYMGLLQVKRYPLAALNISIPYEDVDVNSHPAKREVRFREESRVFSTVQRAVRAVLVADSPVPPLAAPDSGSGYQEILLYDAGRACRDSGDGPGSRRRRGRSGFGLFLGQGAAVSRA